MKRKNALWALCLALLGITLFATVVTAGQAGERAVVVNDTREDSGVAPDIQYLTVSDTGGVVTMALHVGGLQLAEGSDVSWQSAEIYLDTDRNATTGDASGMEFCFQVGIDETGLFSQFWAFDSGEWQTVDPAPQMTYTGSGGEHTFTFGVGELGVGAAFDYRVVALAYANADEVLAADLAPDEGSWFYEPLTTETWNGGGAVASLPDGSLYLGGDDGLWHEIDGATLAALGYGGTTVVSYAELPGGIGDPIATLAPAPTATPPPPVTQPVTVVVKPVIVVPTTVPATPIAGKTFTVRFPVTSSDTGAKLSDGKMVCDPSVRGVVIKHFEQFKDGVATMKFTIPPNAKGKLLKVHLTMKAGGQSTTRNVTFRVS